MRRSTDGSFGKGIVDWCTGLLSSSFNKHQTRPQPRTDAADWRGLHHGEMGILSRTGAGPFHLRLSCLGSSGERHALKLWRNYDLGLVTPSK
jgi:hypothetical protein